MAYRIRYGFDRIGQNRLRQIIRRQIIGSAMLVPASGVIAFLEGGRELLGRFFCAPPVSVAEQAVAAFADALCCGEGWYRGLAVWCRTIIDGGAV